MGSPDSPSLSEVDSHLVSLAFQNNSTAGGIAALVGVFSGIRSVGTEPATDRVGNDTRFTLKDGYDYSQNRHELQSNGSCRCGTGFWHRDSHSRG